jgi:hypothetical protein
MPANTIDEVLSALQEIIDESKQKGERTGYFAALYYQVTAQVKEGILQNKFEDGPRMERLDVSFANRYLAALEQWRGNRPASGCWEVAFKAAGSRSRLVLQHLLLGINAHINLDLGVAAVETARAKGQNIQEIHNDFNSINAILAAMTYEVINDINRISPLLSLMGLHSQNTESLLVQFSISNARDGAWCFAEDLGGKSGDEYAACISGRDTDIVKLAGALAKPRGMIRLTLWVIHLFEWKKARNIIAVLYDRKKTFIKAAMLQ